MKPKILQRYILRQFLLAFSLKLSVLTILFVVFDFLERIDKFVSKGATFAQTMGYFLYKIPFFVNISMPLSALIGTILSVGLLSKNSEITAMRAAGVKVSEIARPIFIASFFLSLVGLLLNETIIPYSQRRVREIYNIDVQQKDKAGGFSQENLWWRSGKEFFSVRTFDSRTNTMHDLVRFKVFPDFGVNDRLDASEATWVNPDLGWTMHNVRVSTFQDGGGVDVANKTSLPLPIPETPEEFYDSEKDPFSMSYRELRHFIKKRESSGVSSRELYADLYGKISFSFIILVVTVLALPFSLIPARTGSMAVSVLASLAIGFSYYVVHSVSVAMGRAEVWPPLLAAWVANMLMGGIGIILNIGAESPS